MKKLALLGSTGSIGTQTLQVMQAAGYAAGALTAHHNIDLLEEQVRRFRPPLAVVYDEAAAARFRAAVSDLPVRVMTGMEGLLEAAGAADNDLVLTAVVGMVGLQPTLCALDAGVPVALANKETLVCGGQLVMRRAREKQVPILPVDSEHSAIFQCLRGKDGNRPSRLILTASGGPFFGKTQRQMANVSPQQALKHPNWNMGAKVSVDSATMMNKGLELIEAMWLYDMPPERIDIVVHRQSIVHSLVEFCDHSVLAQLGVPDMRLPIQYALSFPKRVEGQVERLDLTTCSPLSFEKPDERAFPALTLARLAAAQRGNRGAVLNGADEAAVSLFLARKIGFLDIPRLVRKALEGIAYREAECIEHIVEDDARARELVFSEIG